MRVETHFLKLHHDSVSASEIRVELDELALPCICINPFSLAKGEVDYTLLRDGNLVPMYGVRPKKGFSKANVAFMAGAVLSFVGWDGKEPELCVGLIGLVRQSPYLYASLLFPGVDTKPILLTK